MSCPLENCPIKPFFTKVIEQAQDCYKPPFALPKDAKEVTNQMERNFKKNDELYMFIHGLFVFLGGLFAHVVCGVVALILYIVLAFTWEKFIAKYVEEHMKKFHIPHAAIPAVVFLVAFPFAFLGECVACYFIFPILAYAIVIPHAIFHKYGTKEKLMEKVAEKKAAIETPVVQPAEEKKEEKKKTSSSSSSSEDKKKKD